MILMPDLFSFAYVPNWYSQLDMLAEMLGYHSKCNREKRVGHRKDLC